MGQEELARRGQVSGRDTGRKLQITFAPGVLDALMNHQQRQDEAERGGFRYYLSDMDLGQSSRAHAALLRMGVEHAAPTGYVAFKTPEQQLNGIERLAAAEPKELGWKWRTERDPRPEGQSTDDWVWWRQTQPIEERYIKGTSLDAQREGARAVFFNENEEPYYATAEEFEETAGVNHRTALSQMQSARYKKVAVDGHEVILGFSPTYLKGYIVLDLKDVQREDRAAVHPSQAEYDALRAFMGQPLVPETEVKLFKSQRALPQE